MARDTLLDQVSCLLSSFHRTQLTHLLLGGYAAPAALAARWNSVSSSIQGSGALSFINDWTYKLGEAILNHFGRQQMFDLGVSMRMKYGTLLETFTDVRLQLVSSNHTLTINQFSPCLFSVPSPRIACLPAKPTLRSASSDGHWITSSCSA
jgi:hypothetical protein